MTQSLPYFQRKHIEWRVFLRIVMDYKIIHLQDQQRVETEVDGYQAYVIYRIADKSLDIIHTYVPKPVEGRGIAAALVKYAYTFALEHDLRPLATCSYAAVWLKRNPEYNIV